MDNRFIEILKEGNERKWCMTPYCTTCGSREYRHKLRELAGTLGDPLTDALSEIDINELTSVPNWQDGLLIAIIDLPMSIHLDGILKAWLPKAINNLRFVDYVLFKIVKYLPKEDKTRIDWINKCISLAIETKDFSLVETLILLLGQDAKNSHELMEIATNYAKDSAQMKRVLRHVNANLVVT